VAAPGITACRQIYEPETGRCMCHKCTNIRGCSRPSDGLASRFGSNTALWMEPRARAMPRRAPNSHFVRGRPATSCGGVKMREGGRHHHHRIPTIRSLKAGTRGVIEALEVDMRDVSTLEFRTEFPFY
jgi:hypothetical protein